MPTICSLLWRAYDDSIDMIEAMIEEEKIACSFRRTASSSLLPSPRMCDQTHHTRHIGPRRVRPSRQLGELAHSVQAGEAGADYDHLKIPRDGAGQSSARWN
jgi:hypothetical protein